MPDGRSGDGPTRPAGGAVGPARGSRRAGVRRGCPRTRSVPAPEGVPFPPMGAARSAPPAGDQGVALGDRSRRRLGQRGQTPPWESLAGEARKRCHPWPITAGGTRCWPPADGRRTPCSDPDPRRQRFREPLSGRRASSAAPCPRSTAVRAFANRSPCGTDDRVGRVGRGGRCGGRRKRCAVAAPGQRLQGLGLNRVHKPTRSGVDGVAPPAGRARGWLRGPRGVHA